MRDWRPEVGQECEYRFSNTEWVTLKIIAIHNGEFVGYSQKLDAYFGSTDLEKYRQIVTEADKRRDEQIEKMGQIARTFNGYGKDVQGRKLYEAGCRIIAPDEYVVRALTDEQIDKIMSKYGVARLPANYELIAALQRELGIEV